jgi:hypothetical protein
MARRVSISLLGAHGGRSTALVRRLLGCRRSRGARAGRCLGRPRQQRLQKGVVGGIKGGQTFGVGQPVGQKLGHGACSSEKEEKRGCERRQDVCECEENKNSPCFCKRSNTVVRIWMVAWKRSQALMWEVRRASRESGAATATAAPFSASAWARGATDGRGLPRPRDSVLGRSVPWPAPTEEVAPSPSGTRRSTASTTGTSPSPRAWRLGRGLAEPTIVPGSPLRARLVSPPAGAAGAVETGAGAAFFCVLKIFLHKYNLIKNLSESDKPRNSKN